MPEPLKNLYSPELIQSVAKAFKQEYSAFDEKSYVQAVLSDDWDELELKARMARAAEQLVIFLPDNYQKSVDILLPVSTGFTGLEHMLFPDFIALAGLKDFTNSMRALEFLTVNSSAEFAIRPFISLYPDKALRQLIKWTGSSSKHVRRLASEGCRPRLPWAMALPEFKTDPAPILPVLKSLIADPELYVRRSVANNLNDIAKDNPQVVINMLEEYKGSSAQVDWVLKHASRTLLKQGDKKVLSLFGYKKASHVSLNQFIVDIQVLRGEKLNFQFELCSQSKALGNLRLEFVIDFVKANGKLAGKIFKIGEGLYQEKQRSITKNFSFKTISTRKYYPGRHYLSIIVNGTEVGRKPFELV